MSNYNLVEQQCTTTGTGVKTISGPAPAYRRTFSAGIGTDVAELPCVFVGSDGQYEAGIYAYDESSQTLTAVKIIESSNANAAVNWAAGTRKVYVGGFAATALDGVRHNLSAVAEPSMTDDVTQGYGVGSKWYYVGQFWTCVANAAGNAQWVRDLGYIQFGGATAPVIYTWGAGLNAGTLIDYFFGGLNTTSGQQAVAFASKTVSMEGGVGMLAAKTTDATPKKMAYQDDWATNRGIYVEGASIAALTGRVVAYDVDTGGVSVWAVDAVVVVDAASAVTVVAGATPTVVYDNGSLNAGAATIAVVATGTDNDVTVQVTGIAATNIIWSAFLNLAAATSY